MSDATGTTESANFEKLYKLCEYYSQISVDHVCLVAQN